MAESAPSIEIHTTPEAALPYKPLLGLQGRLAIGGEALNPIVHASFEDVEGAESGITIEDRLKKASVRERRAHWNDQPEQTKDAQLTAWKKSVVTKISSLSQTPIGQQHTEFFSKMGIDCAHYTDDDAQKLYNRYFAKGLDGKGLDIFISDVARAFNTMDVETMESHLVAIQWMANMFGGNSAELVTQLLHVKIEVSNDPETFVQLRKDAINNLSAHEKELLTFLTEEDVVDTTPAKPPIVIPPGVSNEEEELLKIDVKDSFAIQAPRVITITKAELDELAKRNTKVEDISLGNDEEGRAMRVKLGFPDVIGPHGYPIIPSEPYIFVADNLGIGDKNHNQNIKNVCVIVAHGIRGPNNTWKFLNGQEIYKTVMKYNDYAKANGLPPVEFIMSCNAPSQDGVNIRSINTGGGVIAQSADHSIHVSMYRDRATGEINTTATDWSGEFIGIDALIKRKRTALAPGNNIPTAVAGEGFLDPEYQVNPVEQIKQMREETAAEVQKMQKEGKTEDEIKSYILASFQRQILLDHQAFPADDVVREGIPSYLPDGLSDMGSDKETDAAKRTREKIRIDKETMFKNSIDVLYAIFTKQFPADLSEEDRQIWMTRTIARHVYNNIHYDYKDKISTLMRGGQSMYQGEIESLRLGVCRHHTIDTQVLLQSLGIDSRLMKSDLTIEKTLGPHANNLVHIEGKWYLLDSTNPEFMDDAEHKATPYIKLLPESTIDLNTQKYTWTTSDMLIDGKKRTRTYVSRNNMYYRIRDNAVNPAPHHYVP